MRKHRDHADFDRGCPVDMAHDFAEIFGEVQIPEPAGGTVRVGRVTEAQQRNEESAHNDGDENAVKRAIPRPHVLPVGRADDVHKGKSKAEQPVVERDCTENTVALINVIQRVLVDAEPAQPGVDMRAGRRDLARHTRRRIDFRAPFDQRAEEAAKQGRPEDDFAVEGVVVVHACPL